MNNCELSALEQLNNTNGTADYDGIIYATLRWGGDSPTTYGIYINGIQFESAASSGIIRTPITFELKKGDSWEIITGEGVSIYARWYKKRDYSNR